MSRLPNPKHPRYLLALAEFGHFGGAAEACAVTQATLSAVILALERQLDAAILDRGAGKHVMFTALGEEIVTRARKGLAALEAMAEAASAARAAERAVAAGRDPDRRPVPAASADAGAARRLPQPALDSRQARSGFR